MGTGVFRIVVANDVMPFCFLDFWGLVKHIYIYQDLAWPLPELLVVLKNVLDFWGWDRISCLLVAH